MSWSNDCAGEVNVQTPETKRYAQSRSPCQQFIYCETSTPHTRAGAEETKLQCRLLTLKHSVAHGRDASACRAQKLAPLSHLRIAYSMNQSFCAVSRCMMKSLHSLLSDEEVTDEAVMCAYTPSDFPNKRGSFIFSRLLAKGAQ